jgi:hypothetical protein
VRGYYSVKDPGGIFRLVSYEANPDTFQAQVLTNRPGDSNTTFPEVVVPVSVTSPTVSPPLSSTAVPSGLVAEDLIVSTTPSVETTTKDFITITPTVVVEEITTFAPTTTSLPLEVEVITSTTAPTTERPTTMDVTIEEKINPESTPPAPDNPDAVSVITPMPTIIIDSPQYWLEYEVLLNGGRSIYRSEGTREDGNIIGSYIILLDGKAISSSGNSPTVMSDQLRRSPLKRSTRALVLQRN